MGGWEVGDGRATVTGKFDSIDSIVDPDSLPVFAVGYVDGFLYSAIIHMSRANLTRVLRLCKPSP